MESDNKRLGIAIFVAFAACLATAVAGLLPAGLFARAVILRKDSHAGVWLVIGILVYLGWGLLNDGAVHSWAHLKIF